MTKRIKIAASNRMVQAPLADRSDFRSRMQELMAVYGIETESELARILGLSVPTVYHWFGSSRSEPSLYSLAAIAESFPCISVRWLVTGKGRIHDGR